MSYIIFFDGKPLNFPGWKKGTKDLQKEKIGGKGLLMSRLKTLFFSDLLWEASFSVELNIDQIQYMKYTKPSLNNFF